MKPSRSGPLTALVLLATLSPSVALAGCASSASDPSAAAHAGSGLHAGATSTTAIAPALPPVLRAAVVQPSDAPKSAPALGEATALLRAVRVHRRAGFDQVVLEFLGPAVPGYRVRWVTGPVVGDESGLPISVRGAAHLQIVLDPASGVDMARARPTYVGPDRVGVGGAREVTDLVRTGDFGGVLTWVVGAGRMLPFRVDVLRSPSRLVIDVVGGR